MRIVVILSAIAFLLFNYYCIWKFGFQMCYSAYAPKFETKGKVNDWSIVTVMCALMLVPPMIDAAEGSPTQFLGFIAPACLLLVGATPDWQRDKLQNVIHQIGAWGCVAFVLLYVILQTRLLWVVLALLALALIIGLLVVKRNTWMYFVEMAMYMSMYFIIFAML